jgi:hypothetical protein
MPLYRSVGGNAKRVQDGDYRVRELLLTLSNAFLPLLLVEYSLILWLYIGYCARPENVSLPISGQGSARLGTASPLRTNSVADSGVACTLTTVTIRTQGPSTLPMKTTSSTTLTGRAAT